MAIKVLRLNEFRCTCCNYLLAKLNMQIGIMETKCPKCKTINRIETIKDKTKIDGQ
ncbi:Com family DNA-binding transcriptional regulator [Rhizosphaericola mali]|uniref:Com family DNA-binding transcriptional regulator n=1 Tax=Rhizosphaericola mali TaxID=2545455 RepID=A0A5P2G043_9BACT|nr:Com family DNA-binding transcriptional regulator [Rhizosphaericola mali]